MRVLILPILLLFSPLLAAQENVLIDTWNKQAVQDWPDQLPTFTLKQRARLVYINTYHWNGGAGVAPGVIRIRNDDRVFGPWKATGREGDILWEVRPDVLLEPGTYTVADSDISTWSHNRASRGVGFCELRVVYDDGRSGTLSAGGQIDISGKYDLGGGQWVVLQQSGSSISGEWNNGSKLVESRMEGNRLIGKYRYPGASTLGSINYVFAGNCFEGSWEDNGRTGAEKGCRADISGKFDIGGGDWVVFRQSGSSITGEWSNGSKIVEARLEGNRVIGKYLYPGASTPGSIDYAFSGNCFEGRWTDNGKSGIEKGCKKRE